MSPSKTGREQKQGYNFTVPLLCEWFQLIDTYPSKSIWNSQRLWRGIEQTNHVLSVISSDILLFSTDILHQGNPNLIRILTETMDAI